MGLVADTNTGRASQRLVADYPPPPICHCPLDSSRAPSTPLGPAATRAVWPSQLSAPLGSDADRLDSMCNSPTRRAESREASILRRPARACTDNIESSWYGPPCPSHSKRDIGKSAENLSDKTGISDGIVSIYPEYPAIRTRMDAGCHRAQSVLAQSRRSPLGPESKLLEGLAGFTVSSGSLPWGQATPGRRRRQD